MTALRPPRACAHLGGAVSFSLYGRMKSAQRISDAGSIPATSTTAGVHGFDGMNSVDGRLAMVPAASGSAWSGVRCDGPATQTPMTAFIGLLTQPDVPAARNGTKGRHLSYAPGVKHETVAACSPPSGPAIARPLASASPGAPITSSGTGARSGLPFPSQRRGALFMHARCALTRRVDVVRFNCGKAAGRSGPPGNNHDLSAIHTDREPRRRPASPRQPLPLFSVDR